MKLHRISYHLYIIFVLLAISATFLGITVKNAKKDIEAVNVTWNEEFQLYLDKNSVLNRLRHQLGYRGFIHHFKNFLIRRDLSYLTMSRQSLDESNYLLMRLKRLSEKDNLEKALSDIEEMLRNYEKGLKYLESNQAEVLGLSIDSLDALVKVNDLPAEAAFQTITRKLSQEITIANIKTGKKLAETRAEFNIIFQVTIPMLLVLFVMLVFYYRREAKRFLLSEAVLQSLTDAVFIVNQYGQIVKHNRRAEEITGYSTDELDNFVIERLIAGTEAEKHKFLREHLFSEVVMSSEVDRLLENVMVYRRRNEYFQLRNKDGILIPVSVKLSAMLDREATKIIAVVNDLSHVVALREKAEVDTLTLTKNKGTIGEILQAEILRAKRYGRALSVIFVDIDDFKSINDNFGHQVGDELLVDFSALISSRLRHQDSVGRFGGEEFLIVCPETNIEEAIAIADSIRKALEVQVLGGVKKITASFGVSTLDKNDGEDAIVALIKRADDAVYMAKAKGKNCVMSLSR